jgi:hypothetical protein
MIICCVLTGRHFCERFPRLRIQVNPQPKVFHA